MATWNESKPQGSDRVRELGKLVRDQKTHIDESLQKHFYWSDSTTSAGVPRFSDGTGTWRTFWAPASSFSTSPDTGRLMITADGAATWADGTSYSTLRATNFDGATTVSSANVVVRDAAGGAGVTETRYVIDTGEEGGARASGRYENAFTAPFTSAPQVLVTSTDVSARYVVGVFAVSTSGFSSEESSLVAEPTTSGIYWWAVGPVDV
jgi:hypothetical protein